MESVERHLTKLNKIRDVLCARRKKKLHRYSMLYYHLMDYRDVGNLQCRLYSNIQILVKNNNALCLQTADDLTFATCL